MKVSELIAELQKAPKDATVFLNNTGGVGQWIGVEAVRFDGEDVSIEFDADLEYPC
jgi:hypothetical protein